METERNEFRWGGVGAGVATLYKEDKTTAIDTFVTSSGWSLEAHFLLDCLWNNLMQPVTLSVNIAVSFVVKFSVFFAEIKCNIKGNRMLSHIIPSNNLLFN